MALADFSEDCLFFRFIYLKICRKYSSVKSSWMRRPFFRTKVSIKSCTLHYTWRLRYALWLPQKWPARFIQWNCSHSHTEWRGFCWISLAHWPLLSRSCLSQVWISWYRWTQSVPFQRCTYIDILASHQWLRQHWHHHWVGIVFSWETKWLVQVGLEVEGAPHDLTSTRTPHQGCSDTWILTLSSWDSRRSSQTRKTLSYLQ